MFICASRCPSEHLEERNHFDLRNYDPVVPHWNTPDPVKKYPSPYNGMGNNPVSNADPNGADWYKHSETGATVWREGNAKTYDLNGQTYKNIGEKYAHTDDFGTTYYKQNKLVNYVEKGNNIGGTSLSLSAGFAFGGGFGFEAGKVFDLYGDSKWFFSAGVNVGLDIGAGFNFSGIYNEGENRFSVEDYAGYGGSWSLGIGGRFIHGGNNFENILGSVDRTPSLQPGYGKTYTQKGSNYGLGAEFGVMRSFTNTWTH